MTEINDLFYTKMDSIEGYPEHDGWWVLMHEPPKEDGFTQSMIIFMGLPSKEIADQFVDRFEAAINWHLERARNESPPG